MSAGSIDKQGRAAFIEAFAPAIFSWQLTIANRK